MVTNITKWEEAVPGSRGLRLQEQHQQQSNWCWAATTVSITLYYEPGSLTQCQLVNEALGMSTCCQAPQGWNVQQLTGGGNTGGPSAAGDPAVVTYFNQMHVCYRDVDGLIQDVWYDGAHWNVQQLTGGGNTGGPSAAGDPAVVTYNNQMHVCYRNSYALVPGGPVLIQDVWYGSTCNVPWYADQALTITGHFAGEMGPLSLSGPVGLFSGSVVNEIDGGRPISIRIAWNGGGGAHNPAIVGYDTTLLGRIPLENPTIDIQDPIFGFSIQDFNTFPSTYHGGATWTTTYLTSP